jgi:hypothetical protein
MAAIVPLALAALQLGAQFLSGRKKEKHEKALEAARREQENKNRRERARNAIAKAIGDSGVHGLRRNVIEPEAPDTSALDTVAGLGSLGQSVFAQQAPLGSSFPEGTQDRIKGNIERNRLELNRRARDRAIGNTLAQFGGFA